MSLTTFILVVLCAAVVCSQYQSAYRPGSSRRIKGHGLIRGPGGPRGQGGVIGGRRGGRIPHAGNFRHTLRGGRRRSWGNNNNDWDNNNNDWHNNNNDWHNNNNDWRNNNNDWRNNNNDWRNNNNDWRGRNNGAWRPGGRGQSKYQAYRG